MSPAGRCASTALCSSRSEFAGFRGAVRKGVELQVGQVARLDFTMQVGNVSDTVEVVGGATVSLTFPTCIVKSRDRKSTRLNSSHLGTSYAVFCLKKKTKWTAMCLPS